MIVSSELSSAAWTAELPASLRDTLAVVEEAYFRHIDADEFQTVITGTARIFQRHVQLARYRQPGRALVQVYHPEDGLGLGAAVQIVTDDMPLLVESITAAVQRLGVTVSEVVHPIFEVDRDSDGLLCGMRPHEAGGSAADSLPESWMHVQLHPSLPPETLQRISEVVPDVIADVRQVSSDTAAMHERLADLAQELDRSAGSGEAPFDATELTDCANLLRWLAEDNFTVLGYARVRRDEKSSSGAATTVTDSPLGVLRPGVGTDFRIPMTGAKTQLLTMTQGLIPATVHRSVYPYFIAVADAAGGHAIHGEHLFIGVFTVTAMHENVLEIPVIERRVRTVIEDSGFDLDSFSGQAMLEVVQSFPRSELFSADIATIQRTASSVLHMGLRRQVRLFLRPDAYGRFVSAMVYLPRDRYTTRVRFKFQDILLRELNAVSIDYSVRIGESELARVYFTVRLSEAETVGEQGASEISETERLRIQELIAEASRTWEDHLQDAVNTSPILDPTLVDKYRYAFPESYKQDFSPHRALADIARLEQLSAGAIDQHLYRRSDAGPGIWRFTLYIGGSGISLSRVLPVLQSLGVEVLDERPYRISRETDTGDVVEQWIYDFGLKVTAQTTGKSQSADVDAELLDVPPNAVENSRRIAGIRTRFTEAFAALWYRRAEIDRLNEMVLRAGMGWRQIVVLRAYAKYLRQVGFSYSTTNIIRVLLNHPQTARSYLELFEAQFDPDRHSADRAVDIAGGLTAQIDAVVSLDADRVLRAVLELITATLRTNFFRLTNDRDPVGYLSFKFDPQQISVVPQPRPRFEIFVYSPRVEGVHLRFGAVARGGLRWSDRLEDFRTEILGLVKAQAVKNAVIVPVGAKGGFVVKKPPARTGDAVEDRRTALAEGIACYRTFISGLLDVTDNVDKATGAVVPPERVVRRDEDDTYLVVAADKGTASFSDIANEVAGQYDFWLGDAFASGGSAGYDHKEMGITAKGAWESVKRHFAEIGVDTQSEEFTVVGVGDMSGDVFGNGMLLSKTIRLVAAFDHRHIFLDPNPNAARSFAERERLYRMERSSWADYNTALISKGGGVYDRTVKSVPISAQVRTVLGIPEGITKLSPPELMKAIVSAPVDLLWNGGIGTYVKASSETNAEVGDKSNDAVRVDACDLRVRVIGEGGNLGATAWGRIEFAQNGGRINTDALDNSAGVDCSDHEVNIKVLLDAAVSAGELAAADRNGLLADMTQEVSELVLHNNISQNLLMGQSRASAPGMLNVHRRLLTHLEHERGLVRAREALPSDKEIVRRLADGGGLTSPELANLMAQVKLAMKSDLLRGDIPDNAYFSAHLPEYFPKPVRERFAGFLKNHRLRREIVTTMIVNDVVDCGGITYAFRLGEEIGATSSDSVRAFAAVTEIFGLPDLWRRIRELQAPVAVRDELELETKRILDRASRWLLSNRPQPIAVGAEVNRYRPGMRELAPRVPEWLCGHHRTTLEDQVAAQVVRGTPAALARDVFGLLHVFGLLDIIDIADITDRSGSEVAELYFALADHLTIGWLLEAVSALERGDRWHSLARLALRDDVYGSLRSLTLDVLSGGEPHETAEQKIAYWESKNQARLGRSRAALAELFESTPLDLAALSVAARQVRSMVSGVGAQSEVPR